MFYAIIVSKFLWYWYHFISYHMMVVIMIWPSSLNDYLALMPSPGHFMIESTANCCYHSYLKIIKERKIKQWPLYSWHKDFEWLSEPNLSLVMSFYSVLSIFPHFKDWQSNSEIRTCIILKVNAELLLPKDYFKVDDYSHFFHFIF